MSGDIWLDNFDLSTLLGIALALDADEKLAGDVYRWTPRARSLIIKIQDRKARMDRAEKVAQR